MAVPVRNRLEKLIFVSRWKIPSSNKPAPGYLVPVRICAKMLDVRSPTSHIPPMQEPFWKTTALEAMTPDEWESLCDGCGKCCLAKLEDEDTGDIYWTSVGCRLFNAATCGCNDYANRLATVSDRSEERRVGKEWRTAGPPTGSKHQTLRMIDGVDG